MKTDSFWSLIPKGVKVAAAIVFACALIIGPLIGATQWHAAAVNAANGMPPVISPVIGLGMGLLWGHSPLSGCSAWDMSMPMHAAAPCLQFSGFWLYLRSQPAWILLYFAIRRPLGSPCPNCGQLIAGEQRFCSWCGRQSFTPPPAPSGFHSPGPGAGTPSAI